MPENSLTGIFQLDGGKLLAELRHHLTHTSDFAHGRDHLQTRRTCGTLLGWSAEPGCSAQQAGAAQAQGRPLITVAAWLVQSRLLLTTDGVDFQ